jgi:error-prone DNA polymerase
VFLSLEDETGIANVILNPDIYEANRPVINGEKFLLVAGILQNQDGVVSIKASQIHSVSITAAHMESHDYH